jgi:acetoin utilization protein AcuC
MPASAKVCVYAGEDLARYGFGPNHPFGPDRLHAFRQRLRAKGLEARVQIRPPVAARERDLRRFHSAGYLAQVKAQSASGEGYLDQGDTPAFPGMYEAAGFVVGSVLDAIDHILSGHCRRAFVPIAGLHHARRDAAAGFCVFNDCGVAIEVLRQVHGIRRLAYVDIDAHHGDGVFYAFEDDPDLILADLHEDGRVLYPGTGAVEEIGRGPARGRKLNIPLPPFADDRVFERVWPRVESFVERAAPEFILFQCGADSLAGDPITDLQLTSRSHARAARSLCAIAERCCRGRLLALGGGGYKLENLAAAWTAVVRELIGPDRAPDSGETDPDAAV